LTEATLPPHRLDEAERYRRFAAMGLMLVTLLRLFWLAGNPIDLYPDEAQYWMWSRSLALGYFSKPPLIGWIIRATTELGGDDEFGARLAAPLLHFGTALIVFAAARRLYDARIACWSAIVYATLPAVSVSAAIISTDVPLMFFWALALYAFIRAREETGWRWWLLVGVAAGLGLLAKYAMVYWLLSALIFVVAFKEERRHLPKLLCAGAVALLLYSPNFLWNLTHGFVSYRHTGENAAFGGSLFHPKAFLEFFSSQFAVFGPVLFGTLLALVTLFWREFADKRMRLLAAFTLPSLAMMLVVSFLSRAHPNWAAPAYVSASILVTAFLIERGRIFLVGASVALHLAAAVLLVEGRQIAEASGFRLPAKYDLLHRVRGWHTLGNRVGEMLAERPNAILLGDSREDLAALVYYVKPHPFDAAIWNPSGGTRNQFEMSSDLTKLTGRDFLYVTQNPIYDGIASRFESVSAPVHIVIPLGPDLARRYFIYDLKSFKGYR